MWLETVVLIETAAVLWLSALNLVLLAWTLREARGQARRIAALVLACICSGQMLEALYFLWRGEVSPVGPAAAALITVRALVLASAAMLSVLLVRAHRWRP